MLQYYYTQIIAVPGFVFAIDIAVTIAMAVSAIITLIHNNNIICYTGNWGNTNLGMLHVVINY